MAIYDVLGRQVASLVDGPQPPGRHAVSWNGRDGSGGRVGAGIYFVRMQAPGHAETRKVTRLR